MRPAIPAILLACLAFGQSSDKFEFADVHRSPKSSVTFPQTTAPRGGRYEIKYASMVDLIRMAYGYDSDKVLGGPNWLEMDRYHVVAKAPAGANMETVKPMLQALLVDRFKLKTHEEKKPLPTHVLVMGKKNLMKESDGSEEAGCKPQNPSGGQSEGGGFIRMMSMSSNGTPTTFNLGPGMTVHWACRKMTMAQFVNTMRGMLGANLGPNPVLDETGLKGEWNFDFRYSMSLNGPAALQGDRITMQEAIEKQLGLKLEERPIATPVIVVDSVEHTPAPNPPGTAEALPTIPAPTEFEVATVKEADPDSRNSSFMTRPGGRLVVQGMPLSSLVSRAFSTGGGMMPMMMMGSSDSIVGLPAWANSMRVDVNAKAPSSDANAPPLDMEAMSPMIRGLLVDRFKMKYHTEERPVQAHALVAGTSKLKKADPNSRTWCKNIPTPPGAPQGSRALQCQNITMEQFAERLQGQAREITWPVEDKTGIEGGYDFTLIYSFGPMMAMPAGMPMPPPPGAVGGMAGGGGGGGGMGMPSSDPSGGQTIFTAIEKTLGLKLEIQKRTVAVTVIDHLEQKPTEN
jgi:uncharacterized protein (TIGR03435 family)